MSKTYGTGGSRTLSPDCCTSEKLAACSIGAQLLFDRILVAADDQGRLLGEPYALKAACFPLCATATLPQIELWTTELASSGLTKVYHAGSATVVQVFRWWEYQAGMRRAYPSRFAAPEGWSDRTYGIPADDRPGSVAGKVRADRAQSAGAITAPAVAVAVAEEKDTAPAPDAGTAAPAGDSSGSAKGRTYTPKHPRTLELAEYLGDAVRSWKPDSRITTTSARSLRAFDALLTLDGREPDTVGRLIAWVFGGTDSDYSPAADSPFDWRPNIASGESLRKSFDKLESLARRQGALR